MIRSALLFAAIAAAGAAGARQTVIGRLFTTPAERHQLDLQRGLIGAPPQAPVAAATRPVEPPPAEEPVTLNGFVKRSDGKTTVWVNQQAQERATFSGTPPKITVSTPAGGSVTLKPGQTADLHSGRIDDAGAR